jgi:SAM-dependent methyltransferase
MESDAGTTYRGTEGQRPYAAAGWYYAEYRDRVSPEFITLLAERLGWRRTDRVLDLGAGPGQLSILAAPLVTEVVAIEPEPDMLTEGQRRAHGQAIGNVTFIPRANMIRSRRSWPDPRSRTSRL